MGNCLCHTVQVTTFPASVCTLIFLVVVTTSTGITDLFNPSSCYSRVGWPTYYDSAKAALTLMEKTHHVNYLQVFNMHGRLIQPSEYCKVLQDALVQMHFMMIHWYFGPKGQWHAFDVFVADIYTMWVLTPPKATGPMMPRKRKFVNPWWIRWCRTSPLRNSGRLQVLEVGYSFLHSWSNTYMMCKSRRLSQASLLYHQSAHKILQALVIFTLSFMFNIFQLIAKQIITFLSTIFMFDIHSNLLPNKLSHSF